MSERETLDEYVRRIIAAKDLSYRKVAERSRGLVKATTVHDIVNRNVLNVSVNKLKGLAYGLGVPENELFAVARGTTYTPDEKEMASEVGMLFHGADDLTPEGRRRVQETARIIISQLIEQERRAGERLKDN